MEQYINYILMLKNHIATLMIFSNQLKLLYERDKRTKLPLLNFLVKLLTKRKSQINISLMREKHFSRESYKIYQFSNKY